MYLIHYFIREMRLSFKMKRKLFHFIKRFKKYLLCFIVYLAYCMFKGIFLTPVKQQVGRTTIKYEQTRELRNKENSTYPIFSVIALNTTDDAIYDVFAVNTWVNKTANQDARFCCYLMNDGSVSAREVLSLNQRREMFQYVAHIECPNLDLSVSSRLSGISLSKDDTCTNRRNFVKPYFPHRQADEFSFAVCGKLIFGNIDIELTIEWMEFNKHMGVTKVLLYSYNISHEVSALLRFYESHGFVDVIPFKLPKGDVTGHRPGEKTLAAWNDEQLLVYDCQSRLRGFKYVAIVDLDEFIVPIIDNNFKNMMARLVKAHPYMAATEVYGEIFILDWEKTNPDGDLIINQYENRTISKPPNIDINQRKLIHLPDKVQRGSVITHGCKPINSSFKILKDPMSVISINHYRKCGNYRQGCLTRPRVNDKRILRLLKEVKDAVHKTRQKLDIV